MLSWLLIVVGASYLASARLADALRARPGRCRPRSIVLAVGGVTLAGALVASLFISNYYWGYLFARPPLALADVGFERVRAVAFVQSATSGSGEAFFIEYPDSIEKALERCREDVYYCLADRILVVLHDAGRLPRSTGALPATLLTALHAQLQHTGLLVEGEADYVYARRLAGVVVEGEDAGGGRRVFVGVQGGEVSNDHHPYYEVLFAWPDDGGLPALLFASRFYYDIAGIEGLEGPYLFVVFASAAILVTVPLALSMCLVWRLCRLTLRPRSGPA